MPEKNNFIDEVIERIGMGGWQRVQDYLYETKYKEIITRLEKKHQKNTRDIILFFLLCVGAVIAFDYFSPEPEREEPSKADYSPYSGWTHE